MDVGPLLRRRPSTTPAIATRKPTRTLFTKRTNLPGIRSDGRIKIVSDTDQDPSILEIPAVNWANYLSVKSIQYIKMVHAPKVEVDTLND